MCLQLVLSSLITSTTTQPPVAICTIVNDMMTSMMLYKIGEIVLVDNKNKAWIQPLSNDDDDDYHTCNNAEEEQIIVENYTVKYIIDGTIEKNVNLFRLSPTSLENSTRSENNNNVSQSSLRAVHQQQHSTTFVSSTSSPSNTTSPTTNEFQLLQSTIQSTFSFTISSKKKNHCDHPLYNYLKNRYDKDNQGWMRKIIAKNGGNNMNHDDEDHTNDNRHDTNTSSSSSSSSQPTTHPSSSSHLTEHEKNLFITITAFFSSYTTLNGPFISWKKYLQNAFGISKYHTADDITATWINRGFKAVRKVRKDKGNNIFNSLQKRKATFTALNIYRKKRHATFYDSSTPLSNEEILNDYNNLSHAQKLQLDIEAKSQLQRATYLWEELKNVLLKTRGKVSYVALCNYLQNIVCPNTIRNYLQSKEGYYMCRDKIFPHLDKTHKEKRLDWAYRYLTFWDAIAKMDEDKIIHVLIHMDEKWFFAAVLRAYNKVLTSIGLEPSNYHVHHKSHLGKEMFICVTAYVLNKNNIAMGGEAIPVSLVRVGIETEYKRNTYKRVYNEYGRYTMPSEEWNINHKKGTPRFISGVLTGSKQNSKNKKGQHNVSLLQKYQDVIIPDIESKIVEKLKMNRFGRERVVRIILQEDGAGPHNEVKYNKWMDDFFDSKGWLRFNQPPQSPVTNVHDACIFPMMAKILSREQAIRFGSKILVGNQINELVREIFFDKANVVAMSRAFAANHQVALAILQHKGDNNYLKERGGLSFGIRKRFVKNPNGKGVIVYNQAPSNASETTIGSLMEKNRLKYEMPKVAGFDVDNVKLTFEMKKMIAHDFNQYNLIRQMNEEEKNFWKHVLKCNHDDNSSARRVYDNDLYDDEDDEQYDIDDDDDFDDEYDIDDDEEDQFDDDGQPLVDLSLDPNSVPVHM